MNWGPGAQGGFQNALALGMSIGDNINAGFQQGRQMRQERNERNALAAYAKDPSEANFGGLADVRPDLAIGMREQQQAAMAKQQEAQLVQQALGGDDAALGQLATVNFDKWKTLDGQVKAQALEEAQTFGNAALDILQVPYEQRQGRIIGYAQQFPEFAEKINELAYLPQAEQDAMLRGVLADAKMIGKLHEMERPQTFNVGPGEGRYERDPRTGAISTIVQPNYGGAEPFSPVQGGGQQAMPALSDIDAELRRRGVIR